MCDSRTLSIEIFFIKVDFQQSCFLFAEIFEQLKVKNIKISPFLFITWNFRLKNFTLNSQDNEIYSIMEYFNQKIYP